MLVGFGAGGAIDVVARMLVDAMKNYSSSFIVDNRPGAGGRLALSALKSSPADGTVMILTPASMVAVFPHVYKTLSYDAFKDFTPVTTVCSFTFLITVGPMVPAEVRTLADFVKWCLANPKQATYGTAAAGPWLRRAVSNSCICHTEAQTASRTFSAVGLPQQSTPSAPRFRTCSLEGFERWQQPGRSAARCLQMCRRSGRPDIPLSKPSSGSASSFRRILQPKL
jgi:hypothetical protein